MKNGITEGAVNKATSISAKPNLEQEINNSKANGIKIISDQTQKADMPNSMDDTKPNVVKTPQEQLEELKAEQLKARIAFRQYLSSYLSLVWTNEREGNFMANWAQSILDREKEIERLKNELSVKEEKALTKTYSGNNPVLKWIDKIIQRLDKIIQRLDQKLIDDKEALRENQFDKKHEFDLYRMYAKRFSKKEKTNKEINNDFRDSLHVEQNTPQLNSKGIGKSANINVKRNGIQEINNDFRDSLHIEQNTPQLNSKSIAKSTNINVKRKGIQEVNRDI